VEIVDNQVRAFAGQLLRNPAPNAAGRARYERNFSCKAIQG
jgi:hypothetical protein